MSKLMELADAYAQAAVNVEIGLYQGTASNYTQRLEAHDKARAALVAEIERVEIEAECFRFLRHGTALLTFANCCPSAKQKRTT